MLRPNLCDYSDAYIVVKGTIDLLAAAVNENDKIQEDVAFRNNVPIRSCVSKINSTSTDNAEDFDLVMSMYNLSKIIPQHEKVCGIIIEMKLMMLMIMLQMVNHLNIKQK